MSELTALAQRLAGQNAFEKGVQLYKSNQIQNLQFSNQSVKAQVQGTHLYQVELTRVGESFDGGCTCPASEGFDFCKHCVATLLEYSDRLEDFEKMRQGPPAVRIQAHIEQLSEDQAKSVLLDMIKQTPELLEHWLLIADVSSGKLQPKDLKKHFTKALPLRDIWRHDKVRSYFEKAHQTLTNLFNVIELISAQQRFDLCEFTLQRYDKILERVDDSGGYRLSVFTLLERQLALSFQSLTWSNAEKSDYLVGLYNASYNHLTFESIPKKFISADDHQLRDAFFAKLKILVDRKIAVSENIKTSETIVLKQMTKQLIDYYRLNEQYKLALYYSTQIATHLDEYFEIITLAISACEYDIAHEYVMIAQNQSRMLEDKIKADKLALSVALKTEQSEQALQYAWAIFAATLKLEDYKHLCTLTLTLSGDIESLQVRAERALLDQLKMLGNKKHTSLIMRAVESLVEFYLYSEQIDKALSLAKQYELAPDTMQEVAFASLPTRPKASFNLYRQLSLLFPQLGAHKDYVSCIELLKELDSGLQHDDMMSEKFNHLLAELADIFRHKEAFIALLNTAFPQIRQ